MDKPLGILKNCQEGGSLCRAGQRDGITCPEESCDIDDGVRHKDPTVRIIPLTRPTEEEFFDDGTWRPQLLSEVDRRNIEAGNWKRAGGGSLCEQCGYQYYDHRAIVGSGGLHRLCDGRLVKL